VSIKFLTIVDILKVMAKREVKRIELKDVWKIYKMGLVEVPALRGVDFTVHDGDFIAIMGPSGSGKSTAMAMIGALDIPTKGKVVIDGIDVSRLSENQLAKLRGKKIGFIFQTFNLIQSLSALENVVLPMVFQGYLTPEGRVKRAKMLLEIVGLEHRINHRPNELSGGEQQRVSIARALANDPELILADEPTGNLDSKTGKDIMKILCELHSKQKKTIIMITHDINIAKCAQEHVKIVDGRILVK